MKKILIDYFKGYSREKSAIMVSIALSLLQIATLVPIALITQWLFARALPYGDGSRFVTGVLAIIVLCVLNSLAILYNRQVTLKVIKSTIKQLRERLVEKVLSLGRNFFTAEDLESVHTRIVQDTERVDCMTSAFLTQFIPGILVSIGLSAVLIYLSTTLFLVLVATLPVLIILGKWARKGVQHRVLAFHKDFSRFSRGIHFILFYSGLISGAAAEERELARQKEQIASLANSSRAMAWYSTAYNTVQSNVLVFGGIIVLMVGGIQVIHGNTNLGTLLSFYVALNLLISQAKVVIASIPVLVEGKESLRSLSGLLSEINEPANNVRLIQFTDTLTFDGVGFDYGNSFALRNVSFTIPQGSVVGIRGASGSGKTTLAHLLMGYYHPKAGSIRIDGINLSTLDLRNYRRHISLLSQEPQLFSGTLYENLTYGLDSVDDETIVNACILCGIHDEISSFPQGYQTLIGNRGASLSGGQKQRIAIARALIRKPAIIILDEPDNNLSVAITEDILTSIRKMSITTLIISHNPDLLVHADQILHVTDGTVTTHVL